MQSLVVPQGKSARLPHLCQLLALVQSLVLTNIHAGPAPAALCAGGCICRAECGTGDAARACSAGAAAAAAAQRGQACRTRRRCGQPGVPCTDLGCRWGAHSGLYGLAPDALTLFLSNVLCSGTPLHAPHCISGIRGCACVSDMQHTLHAMLRLRAGYSNSAVLAALALAPAALYLHAAAGTGGHGAPRSVPPGRAARPVQGVFDAMQRSRLPLQAATLRRCTCGRSPSCGRGSFRTWAHGWACTTSHTPPPRMTSSPR